MNSDGLLEMQDMYNVCLRTHCREQYFKQKYRLILAKVFDLHGLNMDNVVYEWQVSYHEIYSIDDFERLHGVLVIINHLHKISAIRIYDHGDYKCDIEPRAILAKLRSSDMGSK